MRRRVSKRYAHPCGAMRDRRTKLECKVRVVRRERDHFALVKDREVLKTAEVRLELLAAAGVRKVIAE